MVGRMNADCYWDAVMCQKFVRRIDKFLQFLRARSKIAILSREGCRGVHDLKSSPFTVEFCCYVFVCFWVCRSVLVVCLPGPGDADLKNGKMMLWEWRSLSATYGNILHCYWRCSLHSANKLVGACMTCVGKHIIDALYAYAKLARMGWDGDGNTVVVFALANG
jgi:hypothetical protein